MRMADGKTIFPTLKYSRRDLGVVLAHGPEVTESVPDRNHGQCERRLSVLPPSSYTAGAILSMSLGQS